MRKLRRRVTDRLSEAAVACAPWLSDDLVDSLEAAMGWSGSRLPVLRRIVAENMRDAGVYTPEVHRQYFRHAAANLAGWMHVFRHAPSRHDGRRNRVPPPLAQTIRDRIQLDDSVERLKEVAARGHGAVLMAMHVAELPLWLGRINQATPTTVLARYSRDPGRRRLKERWWQATGLGYVVESRRGQAGARLEKMDAALREGCVMVLAVDMPRKREEGQPTRLLGREIYLPSGAAVLSLLTGAPLMRLGAYRVDGATCLTFDGPFQGQADPDGPDGKGPAIQERLQWWADGFEGFLRESAPLWFFWGDKRWSRLFHRDPRYVRFLDAGDAEATRAAQVDEAT